MKSEESFKLYLCEKVMRSIGNEPDEATYNYCDGKSSEPVRSIEAHKHEKKIGLESYFNKKIRDYIPSNAKALDYGCGPGGRTICWKRKLKIEHMIGIDNSLVHLKSALTFTGSENEDNIFYVLSKGEKLPFSDKTFDVILSYDVFEHVDDVEQCMKECKRILKNGGYLILVFPPFYSPTGLHISQFTRIPWLNVLFDINTISSAYNKIVASYGDKFKNYLTKETTAENSRFGSINCTTILHFDTIVKEQKWYVEEETNLPLFKVGLLSLKHKYISFLLSLPCFIFSNILFTKEYFTHRIVRILRKIN